MIETTAHESSLQHFTTLRALEEALTGATPEEGGCVVQIVVFGPKTSGWAVTREAEGWAFARKLAHVARTDLGCRTLLLERIDRVRTRTDDASHRLSAAGELDPLTRSLARIRRRYDLTLLAQPSPATHPSTLRAGALANGTLLVVTAEQTDADEVREARRLIEIGGGRVLGAVLVGRRRYAPRWVESRLRDPALEAQM